MKEVDGKVQLPSGVKLTTALIESRHSTTVLHLLAGGWAGGAADSADFIKNADLMWKQSVWSSGISAALAAHHLKPGGCIILPGKSLI